MNFQTIKTAIADTLRRDGSGYFRLDTADQQSHSADEILALPLVHVYYSGGEFPKSAGATAGKKIHDATYKVILSVAGEALADLETLDDESATPQTVYNVLANASASNDNADTAFDQLVHVVWNILASPINADFGLGRGTISNVWIEQVVKSQPQYKGDVIIISGTINLTLRCVEYPTGEIGKPGAGITTTLVETIDATANPLTVGTKPGVTVDPKFDTAPQGVKVGT
jgi:hypothetical protein